MPPLKGSKIDRGYATIGEDEGVNYRNIAKAMTDMGYTMNHSSARNYTLRVMKKMAEALVSEWNLPSDNIDFEEVAKSPIFQQGISDVLKEIDVVT
jgi:hypothetical protein